MKIALYCFGGVAGFLLLLYWCMTQVRYRIGGRQLKILIFGLPLRRIPFEEIVNVSKRPGKGFTEHWHTCFKSNHRVLTIQRSRGLRKYISITPKNRYVFMADLKSAVKRFNPQSEWANSTGFDEASLVVTPNDHLLDRRNQAKENEA
jgi:hypothetical protein